MSAIYFDARIDGAQLQKDITNINQQLSRITSSVKKEGTEIDNLSRRMGASLAGAFSVFAAGSFVKDIARVRGEFQQLEVAFETMLGSKANADKLMAQVVDFAAKTPFQLQDVATGAKQLLAYGTAADDIIPTLKALGDVSSGLSVPIERLILNYGQVRTQLKMTGRELRDFNVAGVPIVAELAKNIGVAEDKIADMVEAGKIGFPEVEKAFQTMTSQGGRFNDLMDKQAKTITGLASNFSDAWNKMLNAIGQQNEGIIADTIRGATELTTHYKDVIKILGILVATYGTYKAAVITTAIAQKTATTYGVFDIATKQLQVGATLKAAAAQNALNTAVKANPYVAVASAVAFLISLLVAYGNQTKKTEVYINDLNESIESLGTQTNVDNLISKYNTLKNETNKTKEQQAELNTTISELAKVFPGAISKVDEFGRALDLNYERLVQMNEGLRENALLLSRKDLAESQKQLNALIAERSRLQDEINRGKIEQFDAEGVSMGDVTLSPKGIEERRLKIQGLQEEIKKLAAATATAEDSILSIKAVDVEQFKAQYSELFGDISKQTKEQAEETKNSLEKLLVYQFSDEITATIKSQIDVLNKQLALPTIQEQIIKTTAELKKQKAVLEQMRSPGSISTDTQITDQDSKVKELEKTLQTLSGVSKKESAKTLEEQKKAKEEQLQAEQDFADTKLALERSLQASIIATQKEGAERQIKEAELEFQQELDRIKAQKTEYLKARNAKNNIEPGDAKFDASLSLEEIKIFDTLEINAETVKNDKIVEINKDAAARIKEIWDGVNEVYLTGNQNEVKSINEKYDNLVKAAQKGGASLVDISFINAARLKEIAESNKNYETDIALAKVELEEQIAARRYSIQADGFASEMLLMKKSFEAYKKAQLGRIDVLSKSNKPEDKAQAEVLTAELGVEEFNTQMNALKMISEEIFNVMSGITAQLEEQGYLTQEEAAYAQEWLKAITDGKVAQKVISEAMSALIRSFPESASTKYAEQMERINEALKEQERLINAAKRAGGEEEALRAKIDLLKKQNKAYEAQLKDAKDKLDNTFGGKLNPFYNSRVNDVNDLTIAVKESQNAITEAEQALNDFLAGGVTQNTIADVIAEGFQSGKTSVDDFAEYMNDVLLDAVLNIFKAEILGPQIDALAEYVKNALSDNELTPEEKAEIDRRTKEIADNNKELWENLTGALKLPGADAKSQQGLTGSIRALTEETGSTIAGQMFASREIQQKTYLTGIEQLDGINQSVTHLAEIAKNTRHNVRLEAIENGINSMNTILKERL